MTLSLHVSIRFQRHTSAWQQELESRGVGGNGVAGGIVLEMDPASVTATRTDIDVDDALRPQDAVPSAAAKGSGDERANQDMHVDSVYVAVPQVSETGDTVLGQTELSCHDDAHQAERTEYVTETVPTDVEEDGGEVAGASGTSQTGIDQPSSTNSARTLRLTSTVGPSNPLLAHS